MCIEVINLDGLTDCPNMWWYVVANCAQLVAFALIFGPKAGQSEFLCPRIVWRDSVQHYHHHLVPIHLRRFVAD